MGLRERKKARTQQAIEDAALRLFAERGFDETTLAAIAEAAEISPRTFFGYFPSKESVLFGDFDETFEGLARRLRERDAAESALDALRAWIAGLVDAEGLPDESDAMRRRIINASMALLAHERQLMSRFEALLAEAVAIDLGDDPADLRPRLVAAAATSALIVLRPDPDAPRSRGADPLAQVDETLVFLRGGVAALLQRPTTA